MKILVVDDDPDLLDVTSYALRRHGYNILTATDGVQAVERCEAEHPDLILLDIGLPRLNGFDLARRLRTGAVTAHATLVAVTGWGQDTDRQLAREAGFDEYMVKPVEMERVQAVLRSG